MTCKTSSPDNIPSVLPQTAHTPALRTNLAPSDRQFVIYVCRPRWLYELLHNNASEAVEEREPGADMTQRICTRAAPAGPWPGHTPYLVNAIVKRQPMSPANRVIWLL
jgi:hypothetical protein